MKVFIFSLPFIQNASANALQWTLKSRQSLKSLFPSEKKNNFVGNHNCYTIRCRYALELTWSPKVEESSVKLMHIIIE